MKKVLSSLSPINKILISFLCLILLGSFLLMLPFSTTHGITLTDALFTATSAVCVTGLAVLDTAQDFTRIGQLVILVLIQFGGLGIMTFSIALMAIFSGNLSIKWQYTFESFYNDLKKLPVKNVLKRILLYTFTIETIIAIILFIQFKKIFPIKDALWYSIFHSVSAYCNAGFSTFSDSLMHFQDNYFVIITISTAVILGGIGFIVLAEISRNLMNKRPKKFSAYSLHSKIVITSSLVLLLLGTVTFFSLEYDNSLSLMPTGLKVLNSFFQSVSCRTAGFNSVDIGSLRTSTLFSMIILMFIGGAPGSIAGGVKVTTFWVMIFVIINRFKGEKQIILWNRAVDRDTVDRTTNLFLLSMLFIIFSNFVSLILNSIEVRDPFFEIFFEMTSAFGTVGLSTGITPKLTISGKLFTCLVMFIGRLGPLTLITALTARYKEVNIQYPEENIMIG